MSRTIFSAAIVAAVTTQVTAEAKLGDMATQIACQQLKDLGYTYDSATNTCKRSTFSYAQAKRSYLAHKKSASTKRGESEPLTPEEECSWWGDDWVYNAEIDECVWEISNEEECSWWGAGWVYNAESDECLWEPEEEVISNEEVCSWWGEGWVYNADTDECLWEPEEEDIITNEEVCGWFGDDYVYYADSDECLYEPAGDWEITNEEVCSWFGDDYVYHADSDECLWEPAVIEDPVVIDDLDPETDWLKDLCESFADWGAEWKDGECVYPDDWLSLKEATTKTQSGENAGNGSFFLGFGVGASTVAAAWALCHVSCAKNTKRSVLEPLL